MTRADKARLEAENSKLRAALIEQWLDAHADHCCETWPHPGECHWPAPAVLGDSTRFHNLWPGEREDSFGLSDDGS
jgi:hypothetical protein